MNSRDFTVGLVGMALLLSAGACKEKNAKADPRVAGQTATTENVENSAPAARPEPEAKRTNGELTHGKTKLRFSVALPPGLVEVHDGSSSSRVSYRKGENDFDGYNVMIGIDRDGKRGLEMTKNATQKAFERESATKNAKVIERGDWNGGGWYMAASFVEGGKSRVTVISRVVAGDSVLVCRGDGEGKVASTPEATAKVLTSACKSLTITPG